MESPLSTCDAEIPLHMPKIDAFTAESLQSLRATAQQTARFQAQSEEVKGKLREAEDDLVKALSVKTRKEAKRMALMDAIASAKARVEDLSTSIQEQRTKKQEYAPFLSRQSIGNTALAASEEKLNESTVSKDETQEAISWYNRVLGFHVKGGRGVKFTFKNINVNNPNEEYFFTICHEDDVYTLLSCEPSLDDTKDLIHELNKTNGLFKFVRVMRKKFQEAVAQVAPEESAHASTSAPGLSMSSLRSDSPTKKSEHQVESLEGSTQLKKQNVFRRVKSAVLSPGSASSVRQSPRLKHEHQLADSVGTKKRAQSEHVANLSLSDLEKYFDVPIVEASENLNVGLTVLRRKCREFGIPRWPYRKIKSLEQSHS